MCWNYIESNDSILSYARLMNFAKPFGCRVLHMSFSDHSSSSRLICSKGEVGVGGLLVKSCVSPSIISFSSLRAVIYSTSILKSPDYPEQRQKDRYIFKKCNWSSVGLWNGSCDLLSIYFLRMTIPSCFEVLTLCAICSFWKKTNED